MEPGNPPPRPSGPPPEAALVKLCRAAAGMSSAEQAAVAVRAAGGKISAAYWRDVERGSGWSRGKLVPVRASAPTLAWMARVLPAITPERLAEAARQHPAGEDRDRVLEAAGILAEMLNQEEALSAPEARARRLETALRAAAVKGNADPSGDSLFDDPADVQAWDMLALADLAPADRAKAMLKKWRVESPSPVSGQVAGTA